MRTTALILPVVLAACIEPDTPTGAEDFTAFCASCHGLTGQGDGEAAAVLDRQPADLTRLAAANGGVFPGTAVMAKIWGYADNDNGSVMPAFRDLLQSELVPFDGGDGIATPTPIRLVQLAEHLGRLQD